MIILLMTFCKIKHGGSMKKAINPLFVAVISLFLFSGQAEAYVQGNGFLCVNDGNDAGARGVDLQTALDDVSDTLNEIRLIQEIYSIANDPSGHFNITADHSLTISGGWNSDCSSRTDNKDLTILLGGPLQELVGGGVLSVRIVGNQDPATVAISNLTMRNGETDESGGSFYFFYDNGNQTSSGSLSISNVTIESNSARTLGSGIAIWNEGSSHRLDVDISDCIIRDNTVPVNSGGGPAGIYINDIFSGIGVDVSIARCQITDNMADGGGGGVHLDVKEGDATLVNNVIARNTTLDDTGGGLYFYNEFGGSLTLTNNTITENEGGGLYLELLTDSSRIDIYNNIILNNSIFDTSVDNDGLDIYIDDPDGNEVAIKNNDFNTSVPEGFYISNDAALSLENNLDNEDPLFADAASNDFHLTSLSPVIDMGDNAAPAVPSDDLDGLTRPVNGTVDMGAYEYQGAASTTTTVPGATTTTTTLPPTTTTTGPATTTTSTTVPATTTTTTVPATTTTTLAGGSSTTTTLPATSTTTTTPSTTTTSTSSTTLPGSTTTTTVPGKKSNSSSKLCFIATAAYGSYMADDVVALRNFRDEHLLTNTAGRAFVEFYYAHSPPIADYIAAHDTLRLLTRISLTPLVFTAKNPLSAGFMVLLLGIFLVGGVLRKTEE